MPKIDKIRFCSKCRVSIPIGDTYYPHGKKEYCLKCERRRNRLVPFLAILVFALGLFGGEKAYIDIDKRINKNTEAIFETNKNLRSLEQKTGRTFMIVSHWLQDMDARVKHIYEKYESEAGALSALVAQTRKEVKELLAAQEQVRKELKEGKLTEQEMNELFKSALVRLRLLDAKVSAIQHSPDQIIKKMLSPTVAICLADKKGERGTRGSGVLFSREELKDPNGKKIYRYRGFTAYHVWHGIFNYLENKQPKLKKDMRLHPKLVIKYFGGSTSARHVITGAKFIHPTRYKGFISDEDIAVFEFMSFVKMDIAELASNEEIKTNLYVGSPIFTTGVAIHKAPTLYTGIASNARISIAGEMRGPWAFHAYAFYGQSGGPIFDAKTLKVIGINQMVHVMPGAFGGSTPDTNVLYGHSLATLRAKWKLTAPKELKGVLD